MQLAQNAVQVDCQAVAGPTRDLQFDQALARAAHDAHIIDQPAVGLRLHNGVDGACAQQGKEQEEDFQSVFQQGLHTARSVSNFFYGKVFTEFC